MSVDIPTIDNGKPEGKNELDPTLLPIVQENENGSLSVTKSLIPNINVARGLVNRFRYQHLDRILLYASIQGLIDGNPPYDVDMLEQDKLSHIANFNNMDAAALIDKASLAYWNLINEPQCLYKFEFNDVSPLPAPDTTGASEEQKAVSEETIDPALFSKDPASLFVAEIMAEELEKVMRSWPSFIRNHNVLAAQFTSFGLSPIVWSNKKDWRWDIVPVERFYVADQASTDPAKLTHVFVETDYTLQYLFDVYETIKDVQDTSKIPWDKEALRDLLLYYGNALVGGGQQANRRIDNPMDIQKIIQNGDMGWSANFTDTIRLVNGIFVEWNGKVSHIIFDRLDNTTKIIYRDGEQSNFIQESILIFGASPRAQTIHANIGVGQKIFAACQATMQLDCSLVDGAKLASTVFVNTPVGTVGQSADAIRIFPGAPTNIGTAVLQQNNLGSNLQPLIGVSSFISQKVQNNIAASGDDQAIPDSGQGSKSAPEARLDRLSRYAPQKNSISQYYSNLDILTRNVVVRLLHSKEGDPGHSYAKKWKDRCIARGVPETLFELRNLDEWGMPAHLSVKAARMLGDGSQQALLLKLESLMPIAGDFGPREARAYRRQFILATAGKEFLPEFMQDSNENDELTGGASLAHMENVAMQEGKSALFSPENDQRGHISQHFALGENTIQAVQQQQMDVIQADQIMGVLIPHLDEHIQFFSRSPFGVQFIKGITPAWNQLQAWADLNRKNAARAYQAEIKKRQEDEAQTQQVMSDEERKDFQAQRDEQRKDFKARGAESRAERAFQVKANVLQATTNAKIRNDEIKTDNEAANNRRKTNLEHSRAEVELANKDALASMSTETLRGNLKNINGQTPAPYDIET